MYTYTHAEVLSYEEHILKLRVAREHVAQTVSELLSKTAVLDLNIEEEDISLVIEQLMRTGIAA